MTSDGNKQSLIGRWFSKASPDTSKKPPNPSDPSPDHDEPAANPIPPETAAPSDQSPPPEPPAKKSWFQRLKSGLAKTSSRIGEGLANVLQRRRLDDDALQDIEDLLLQADLGVDTTMRIVDAISEGRYDKEISGDDVRAIVAKEVADVIRPVAKPLTIPSTNKPHIILMVGVNGTGKTTTIGKLAHQFTEQGKSVVLAAGDTFRAAAIEQLTIWGERIGVPVVSAAVGADAAGLAYDAVQQAQAQQADIVMIDTAGRLQNKQGLMDELEKVIRVIKKLDPDAPHDVLLVLDATTGQNALNQVDVFKQKTNVTGLIMTKLDGTARGGILVAIAAAHQLPVHAIGIGEGIDDLQPFDAEEFAQALVLD